MHDACRVCRSNVTSVTWRRKDERKRPTGGGARWPAPAMEWTLQRDAGVEEEQRRWRKRARAGDARPLFVNFHSVFDLFTKSFDVPIF